MDTNPFAVSANNPQQQQQTPSMVPSQASMNNGTPAGGVASMVKALMDGNQQYQQKQAALGNSPSLMPGSAVPGAMGPSAMGGPAGPMPVNPAAMAGGLPAGTTTGMASAGPMAPMTPVPPMAANPSPFMNGAAPTGVDPMTQALFSPIPGGQ